MNMAIKKLLEQDQAQDHDYQTANKAYYWKMGIAVRFGNREKLID